jgi:transcriptional regulator with GAF, ATPase, and Fis domain
MKNDVLVRVKVILPSLLSFNVSLNGEGPWIVGSLIDCDVPVRAKGVSRRHLEIKKENGSFVFTDLGSTNGCWLNGIRTNKGILPSDEILQIGEAKLEILGSATDQIANIDSSSGLRVESSFEIDWMNSQIDQRISGNDFFNFEFLTMMMDKFIAEGCIGQEYEMVCKFLKGCMGMTSVRCYEWFDEDILLKAECGIFPDSELKENAIEAMASLHKITSLIMENRETQLYFISIPIKVEERQIVFLCVKPYQNDLLAHFQEIIPLFFVQCRIVMKWGVELNLKEETLSRIKKKLTILESGLIPDEDALEPIVGQSSALIKEIKIADHIAQTSMPVLICGATGTGKELFARRIHKKSDRSSGPLIPINCSSIPENLLESELFGVERGAYTGATQKRAGFFEMANGGTIFLDEIGDLTLSLQPKLLRVLEEGNITPLGSSVARKVDVRVIAATNQDLSKSVENGQFRKDLFYRLTAGMPIRLPLLSERNGDILLLSNYFLLVANREFGRNFRGFEEKAIRLLEKHNWPGNVRELQGVVKQIVVLFNENIVTEAMVDEVLNRHQVHKCTDGDTLWTMPLGQAKAEFEKEYLSRRVKSSNVTMADLAKELGITRPNLYLKLRKYGFDKKD